MLMLYMYFIVSSGQLPPDGAISSHIRLPGWHDEVLRPPHEGGS